MTMSEQERVDLIRRLTEIADRLDPTGAARGRSSEYLSREQERRIAEAQAEHEALQALGMPGTDGRVSLADDYRRAAEQAAGMHTANTDNDKENN